MAFHLLLDLLTPMTHPPEKLVRRIHDKINNQATLNRYKETLAHWKERNLRTKALGDLEPKGLELFYKYVCVFNKMFFSKGLPPQKYKLVLANNPNDKGIRPENGGIDAYPKARTTPYIPSPTQGTKFQDLFVI